ncbi:hypothetical protein TWF694_004049 [Orbilia ellipsospora]|uniref:Uncharacterized protein n=1 Tax=Orbilia ellipsospora TaxID=2528407 RepID=A0AAV9WZD9_9PEZI
MRPSWLIPTALTGIWLLFDQCVQAAPGNLQQRGPWANAPTTSSEAPVAPVGYYYEFTPATSAAVETSSQIREPHVSEYTPSCSDWILCYSCPGGYYCPESEASTTQSSLVILPTCASWKACPECRGGYKCWRPKSTSTEIAAETISTGLTVVPTCYPYKYCYSCIGGYSCLAPTTTKYIGTALNPIVYPTCPDYVLCPTCEGGYICPSVTRASAVSAHTKYLPTCSNYQPCSTCKWGWSCPTPVPTNTYTIVITKGTLYATVTEKVPSGYYGYGTSAIGVSSETATIYNWASYEQPTCTNYIVCPTCDIGYYCPTSSSTQGPSPSIYYLPPSLEQSQASTVPPSPTFYPPPPCDNYVICPSCFLGYYCPISSERPTSSTASATSAISYGAPTCANYIVCPTCPLGYYCPKLSTSQSPTGSKYYQSSIPASFANPSYSIPPCDDYIVCPTCLLGYSCPSKSSPPTPTSIYYQKPSSEATTPTYNWASYEQPTCPNYVVCPTCPLGYYCPSSTERTTNPKTPQKYGTPTCTDYIVCPTCALGYSCPEGRGTPSAPIYYTTPIDTSTSQGERNPYLPSTTYYIGLPTTTIVVSPTCSAYVLCPACPSGFYCPLESTSATQSKDATYYNSKPTTTENPSLSVPPCDVYVFCPECELGYSCLMTPTSRSAYRPGGTANPAMSNPTYYSPLPNPSIDATYVKTTENPIYESATIPVPEVPTCANYALCPTCPSGYYCLSTIEPTFASSTKYGVIPTGIIESVYSTRILPPHYGASDLCPSATETVTVTETRDVYRIYNTCGDNPYIILSSFALPTVTITQCDLKYPETYELPTPVPTNDSKWVDISRAPVLL